MIKVFFTYVWGPPTACAVSRVSRDLFHLRLGDCRATNRMRFRVNLGETRWWGCDGRRA